MKQNLRLIEKLEFVGMEYKNSAAIAEDRR